MGNVWVIGAAGCIGSWIARHLLDDGHRVVAVDISDETHRLRMLGLEGRLPVHRADVRDYEALERLADRERPDGVIHLAALQIPTCRADPRLCSEVNVGGMMNLLELARHRGFPLVYASSAAVYGPELGRPLSEAEGVHPQTLYGVFKRANEEMARIYFQDYGVLSAGFRPYTVYGPGRDVGITSDITVALLHAARGERFRIRFGGAVALQHASDVARAFIQAVLHPRPGSAIYNLRGTVATVDDIIRTIEATTGTRDLVTHAGAPLPIAADLSDQAFQRDHGPFTYMALEDGFRRTLEVWRAAAYV